MTDTVAASASTSPHPMPSPPLQFPIATSLTSQPSEPSPHQQGDGLPHLPADPARGASSPSAAQRLRVKIKTRRRRYLDLHPEYFDSPTLELADPLLYDRLIRRFQSAAEREAEGRRKGFAGGLEAGLGLVEAEREREERGKGLTKGEGERNNGAVNGTMEDEEEAEDAVPADKEEGRIWWRREMEVRFLRGADEDFEYEGVDGSEEFDDRAWEDGRDEESWFEGEEPVWVVGDGEVEVEAEALGDDGGEAPGLVLTGQTGVQDF